MGAAEDADEDADADSSVDVDLVLDGASEALERSDCGSIAP